MTSRGDIGKVTETGRSGGRISLEWRIPYFLSLAGYRGDYYYSPFFNACDGEWCLMIFPYGILHFSPSDMVSQYLWRVDGGPPKTFNVTIGIKGAGGVENKRERSQEITYDDDACFWNQFCSRSKLHEEKSRLMTGNELVIALDIKSNEPSVARDSSSQRVEAFKEAEVASQGNHYWEKQGGEKALEDLGKLLASGEKSDVTIQLGDVEFNVHSSILSARSPALSLSLQHDSKEKATNKIIIEDCEPGAFRHFLRYLYMGSVQSLDEQTVFALYRIADKYLAEDLKKHCLQHIQDTLSVQTFCNSMKLALMYGESGLLQKATDFAAENIRFLLGNVEWKDFMHEYYNEANEIIIKSLGPPCNCKRLKR